MYRKTAFTLGTVLSLLIIGSLHSGPRKLKLTDMYSGESPYWIKIYRVKRIDKNILESCKPAGCTDGIDVLLNIGTKDEAAFPPVFSDRLYFTIDDIDYRDVTIQEMGKAIRERLTLYSHDTIGEKNPEVAKVVGRYELPEGTSSILHVVMPGGKIDLKKKLAVRYRLSNKADSKIDYQFTKDVKLGPP